MTNTYTAFLESKARLYAGRGIEAEPGDVHGLLHEWQRELVAWAVSKGRCAIWADTGLGKTLMQIEWARIVAADDGYALIVAPLAVCQQTIREAAKVAVDARYVKSSADMPEPGMYVTNYERVGGFDPAQLAAVVLDEASILKQADGATRKMLTSHFAQVPYRLACTATPAPNDVEELANQAEFVGASTRVNMLAAYFVHDQDGWRPKGHARVPMFRWMSSWAVAIRRPSDLGYPDDGYELPGLVISPHYIDVPITPEEQLFATDLGGVGGRAQIRRETLDARCQFAADLVDAEPDEPWVLWCGLNAEADRLAELTGGTNVQGSWSAEDKAAALLGFADGSIRVLITKPSIAAFGLNWQHCARMAFVGLSDSYEAYYQSIRRCYRYGQQRIVEAHIVLSTVEQAIAQNVQRKERDAVGVMAELVAEMTNAMDTNER